MSMTEAMISTFEMLIERLNAVETRLDELQAVAATEQECKHVGQINTRAWNKDVDLYVHERVPHRNPSWEDEREKTAYVVHTNLDVDWYWHGCMGKRFAGEYDDRLKEPEIVTVRRKWLNAIKKERECYVRTKI